MKSMPRNNQNRVMPLPEKGMHFRIKHLTNLKFIHLAATLKSYASACELLLHCIPTFGYFRKSIQKDSLIRFVVPQF